MSHSTQRKDEARKRRTKQSTQQHTITKPCKACLEDVLVPCVYIANERTTKYSFVLDINKSYETLATTRAQPVEYSTIVPRNFEDSMQHIKLTDCTMHFINYYIDRYLILANRHHKNEDEIRKDMFLLAQHSINEFATCDTARTLCGSVSLALASKARKALVKCHTQQIHMLEFYKQIHELTSTNDMRDIFLQLSFASVNDPSIVFAVDFAMFNIVRRAQVDTRDAPDKFEDTAKEYIVSALAQMAFCPNKANTHLRTYQQKVASIQQLNLHSHLFSLVVDAAIQPRDDISTILLEEVNVVLGHIAILNYLSRSNYLVKSIILQTKAGITGEQYVKGILNTVRDIGTKTVSIYLARLTDELYTANCTKNTDAMIYAYHKLYICVIGQAIRHNQYSCQALNNLCQRASLLEEDDFNALDRLASGKTKFIPVTQAAGFTLLHDMWMLEHILYDTYVNHYKLDIHQLHGIGTMRLLERVLHTTTYSTDKDSTLHVFDPNDIHAIQATLQSKYLNKYNDPQLCSQTGVLVELCDPDNRLCDLYAISTSKEHMAFTSNTCYKIAQKCALQIAK